MIVSFRISYNYHENSTFSLSALISYKHSSAWICGSVNDNISISYHIFRHFQSVSVQRRFSWCCDVFYFFLHNYLENPLLLYYFEIISNTLKILSKVNRNSWRFNLWRVLAFPEIFNFSSQERLLPEPSLTLAVMQIQIFDCFCLR